MNIIEPNALGQRFDDNERYDSVSLASEAALAQWYHRFTTAPLVAPESSYTVECYQTNHASEGQVE